MAESTGGISKTNLFLMLVCAGVVAWLYGKELIVDRLGIDPAILGLELQTPERQAEAIDTPGPIDRSVVPIQGIVVMDMELYMNDPEVVRQKLTPDQVRTKAAELARDYAAKGYAVLMRSDTVAVPANAIIPLFE
ncbi:hypothetical protein [Marinobacter goseongensis]|uniref:hypothetical protein n=1 Tax=Marinobacter goseongensis TaxID=453838 RepID=UPI0020031596|nr:hypothetical protein [Marinobacter goseongensis]MCK7553312.1 hypothetical protein [Marinobacter goseongensis]